MNIRLPKPRAEEAMASEALREDGFRFGGIVPEASHGPEADSNWCTLIVERLPSCVIGSPTAIIVGRMAALCIAERPPLDRVE